MSSGNPHNLSKDWKTRRGALPDTKMYSLDEGEPPKPPKPTGGPAISTTRAAVSQEQGTHYSRAQIRTRTPSPARSSSAATSSNPPSTHFLSHDIHVTFEGPDNRIFARLDARPVRLPKALFDKFEKFPSTHGYVPPGFVLEGHYLTMKVASVTADTFYISAWNDRCLPKHVPTTFRADDVRQLLPRQSSSSLSQRFGAGKQQAAQPYVLSKALSMTLDVQRKLCAFRVDQQTVFLRKSVHRALQAYLLAMSGGNLRSATLSGVNVIMQATGAGWEIGEVKLASSSR